MNPSSNLSDFYKDALNPNQQAAVVRLSEFLAGDAPIFLLKGYAGTGKTFLLAGLVNYLRARQQNFRLMAPTGRAARILREKTRADANTIHRTIYALEQTLELPPETDRDNVSYKHYFIQRPNLDSVNAIYIVDEASMISDLAEEEAEFLKFGSGRLLHDLIEYVNPATAGIRRKMIFVGDTAQLPPISSPTSPALDAAYFSIEYGLSAQEVTLTQVIRQKENSGILLNATALRTAVSAQKFHTFSVDDRLADVTSVHPETFLSTFLTASKNHIDGTTIIVTYSNRAALEHNQQIREHFFPNKPGLCPGDKIIVVRNNYHHKQVLFNGEFGKVLNVSDQVETRAIPIKSHDGGQKIQLDFRDVVIRFWDENKRGFDIPCKIFDSLLNSPERGLRPEETRALYIDFRIRHPRLNPKTKEFQDKLLDDPYFNAVQIKYGYAVTCHKAQGGEWDNVLVDFNMSMGKTSEQFFRWAYTAITRASAHLYAISPPQFNRFSSMTIAPITETLDLNKTRWTMDDVFFDTLRQRVTDTVQGTAITIEAVRHNQYCEVYMFSEKDKTCWVNIWYKKTGSISRIEPRKFGSALATKLSALLATLMQQTLEPPNTTHIPTSVSTQKPFLQALQTHISAAITPYGIEITNIKHHKFQEAYFFQRDGQSVRFDFYYNNKGQFTTVKPHPSVNNAPELFTKLTEILQEVSRVKR